jgi:hypothetical protein
LLFTLPSSTGDAIECLQDYNDAVDRARKWLKETEPRVAKLCNEPIAAEPRVVEDQLNRAKALNSEIIANGKLIEDAKAAAHNLLASLDESQISREEKRLIEQTPVELQQRYDALRVMMAERRVFSFPDFCTLNRVNIEHAWSNGPSSEVGWGGGGPSGGITPWPVSSQGALGGVVVI